MLQDSMELKINGVPVHAEKESNPFLYENKYLEFIAEYNVNPEVPIPQKTTNKTCGKIRCWQDKTTKEYIWTVYGDLVKTVEFI